MLRELIDAGMLLTAVAGAVGLVVVFGRDPKGADEHTVDQYREYAAWLRQGRQVDAAGAAPGCYRCQLGDPHEVHETAAEVYGMVEPPALPSARQAWPLAAAPVVPAPAAEVPWRPPYAELVIAQVLRRYGDDPADIAARFLRGIAEEQRAVAA